jgi:uncharacterized protein YbjT (DUF2867 family)
MDSTTTFGVIGATGKTGRRVVARLESAGHSVRRLARGSTPAFDWNEPEVWPAALAGIDRVYVAYVPDLAVAGSAAAIRAFTEVARGAGVSQIVLLSGRGEDGARAAEDIVLACGIDSTIVRASWFSQNFTEGMLADSVAAGFIAIPAGDRLEPFVDVDDIADVAFVALTAAGHAGRVFEVTGPELLGFADAAALLGESAGHPVAYLPVSFDEFHAAIAAEVDLATADLLTDLCREVFDGRNESLTTGVQDALGREPRSLRAVIAEARLVERPAVAS